MSGSIENNVTNSLPAGADLSAASRKAVKVNASGQLVLVDARLTQASGQVFKGVIGKNAGVTSGGRQGYIGPGGYAYVKAGAAQTKGTHSALTVDANGDFIPCATGDIQVAVWDGEGLETSGGTQVGDLIRVFICAPTPYTLSA